MVAEGSAIASQDWKMELLSGAMGEVPHTAGTGDYEGGHSLHQSIAPEGGEHEVVESCEHGIRVACDVREDITRSDVACRTD